jgi:cyclopropane fatty-acyl-phospholipid synthase-like methyltransferase
MDVGKALGSIAEDDFAKREAHLEAAQYAKIDAMIDRLGLKPGDKKRVLEIGCGWGALAIRLCERFPLCSVTGLTLSNEQHAEATKRVAAAGLSDRIEIVIRDYRDVTEIYDAVISIEMLEAVGHEHLPTYFNAVSKALRPDGVASIQVITMPDERYASYCASESDFIRAYIFPGGHLPSVGAMKHAATPNGLSLTSFDDIGEHYAVTLRLWRERMMARRDVIVGELGYSEKFVRMFEFYFAYCEAGFARGLINDLQMTWVKTGDAKSLKAETSQGSKSAAEIAAAGDARRVSVLAVFSYVAFAAYEAASKGIFEALTNATHIFGVVFCTLLIAATHAVVFVAYAGAFAAVGAAGDKTKTKTQKPQTPSLVSVDSRRVASPAGAAAVRCAVAFAAVLSVTEKLTAVSFMSTGVAGLTEAFQTAFLGSNTPVQENLTATLATLGAASAAFASLVSSALASGSSNDPITRPTPGVTRSVRDVQVLTSNKIVDAFILLVCVFALRHETFLDATAYFATAHVAAFFASLAETVRAASGYPGRDPASNVRRLTDTASEVSFVAFRVVPHVAAIALTAAKGTETVAGVGSALVAAAAAKFAGAPVDFFAAAAAAPAADLAAAAVAAAATAALALDAGAWGRAARARTAESAVRDRIIRLATSADV